MAATNAFFEVLENRTMMSATPIAAVTAHHVAAPAVHATKSPAKSVIKTAAPIVEPKVTDATIKYQSFANQPLFSIAGPSVNDINQGYAGDCYFLSALSSIAKTNPAAIRKDVTANTDGTFTVHFLAGKTAKNVTVDAMLPVWSNGQLAYAGMGNGNSVWVAVMEKAWAVYRNNANSYASIEAGWMSEAFAALGVKATSVATAKTGTALLNTLQKDLKTGQATTLGTNNKIADGTNLIGGHAYEVDSIVVDSTGTPTAVVLRNPWGVDGAGNDGSNDGYVTITGQQLLNACSGVVSAFA